MSPHRILTCHVKYVRPPDMKLLHWLNLTFIFVTTCSYWAQAQQETFSPDNLKEYQAAIGDCSTTTRTSPAGKVDPIFNRVPLTLTGESHTSQPCPFPRSRNRITAPGAVISNIIALKPNTLPGTDLVIASLITQMKLQFGQLEVANRNYCYSLGRDAGRLIWWGLKGNNPSNFEWIKEQDIQTEQSCVSGVRMSDGTLGNRITLTRTVTFCCGVN